MSLRGGKLKLSPWGLLSQHKEHRILTQTTSAKEVLTVKIYKVPKEQNSMKETQQKIGQLTLY